MSRLGASFPGQPQPSCQSWPTSDSVQETEILTHRKFSNILSVSSWCHRKWLVTCRSDRKLYPESPVHVSRVRHRATKQEEEASGGHWSWNTEEDSSFGVGEEAWVSSSTIFKIIYSTISFCSYWCTKCKKRFPSQAKLVDHMSYSVEHNYKEEHKKRKTR